MIILGLNAYLQLWFMSSRTSHGLTAYHADSPSIGSCPHELRASGKFRFVRTRT